MRFFPSSSLPPPIWSRPIKTVQPPAAGVTLPAGEEAQVIESLQALSGKGCEILVCGTCLNYYGLTERLKVGTVSNMYDIADKLLRASRVVTL